MSNLLDITGTDIASLNDADLRELIGRLCEADFRAGGVSTNGITWGGNQDAPDGGVDVSVESNEPPPKNSRIPRKITKIQVKKPKMARSAILKEMKPKGRLRDEIKRLIAASGAYLIVSSGDSTTGRAKKNRIAAMTEAVQDEENSDQLKVGFLDRNEVATWVRDHPSVIIWVRNKIGQPLQGWQPYANWSNPAGGIEEEYIIGDQFRLFEGLGRQDGDSVVDGLQKLRTRLSKAGASVRLAGLSGVGKTRLVQALFDDRIGESALDPAWAYYTDISDEPLPTPQSFAAQLVALGIPAVLIIDNCSQELHRSLQKACLGTQVRLLTVEYDIQDDLPKGTDVFYLGPSGNELIEQLLDKRYPYLSQINMKTITEFANGNARVAIALADGLRGDENISTLTDRALFDRLFHQRDGVKEGLKTSAEVCSLVYSFNGDDLKSTGAELKLLAQIAEKTTMELYRDVAELKRRGLVQARSVWRAVLPHAIANRLAEDALESIPKSQIVDTFVRKGSERLLKSFTRRLSYLHNCEQACDIATDWLKSDGWIGIAEGEFSPFGWRVFKNVAPIVPEATLAMLEDIVAKHGIERIKNQDSIMLLRHLAYDADLFQRSVRLLYEIAVLEERKSNGSSPARRVLEQLFYLLLSGTHAPAEMRAQVINELLRSSILVEQELGVDLLDAALETHNFRPYSPRTFGARVRDYGFWPNASEEYADWYRYFLKIATWVTDPNISIYRQARARLATHIRGLWSMFGKNFPHDFLSEIEDVIVEIHKTEAWHEGWIVIKNAIHYDAESLDEQALARLQELEQSLRPTTLIEQARTYGLTYERFHFNPEFWENLDEKIRSIGRQVAENEEVFNVLLPDLVTSSLNQAFTLGRGLAQEKSRREEIWNALYRQIERTPPEQRQISVMRGFLSECARLDSNFYNQVLDSLLTDKLLGQWFVHFQTSVPLDSRGIQRLHKALERDDVNIHNFKRLALARRHEQINDEELTRLLQVLASKKEGVPIVLDILQMRLHATEGQERTRSKSLVSLSRDVLLNYDYQQRGDFRDSYDYKMAEVARFAFQGGTGTPAAKEFCRKFCEGVKQHEIRSSRFPRLLNTLAEVQPYVFLDSFVGRVKDTFRVINFSDRNGEENPLNKMPKEIIIEWCEQDPATRYLLIASYLHTYLRTYDDSSPFEWHPHVYMLIDKAPDLTSLLEVFARDIRPMAWSGSQAEATAKRLKLFDDLSSHPKLEVREWANAQHENLQRDIEQMRVEEARENKVQFERFE